MLLSLCVSLLTLLPSVQAAEIVWDQQQQEWVRPADIARRAVAGDILVLGEQHAFNDNFSEPGIAAQHANQLRLMEMLFAAKHKVSLGMEFLDYPFQTATNEYLIGALAEADFLEQVGFGAHFPAYREQILFPPGHGGLTLALNMPRSVTSTVGRSGPLSLSEEQRALLPPIWELGTATYFKRFTEVMGEHVPASAIERYFWAHSLWDDTMAWKATEYRAAINDDVLLIIVGEFHAEYGDGLTARIRRHGWSQVKTVIQQELTVEEFAALPEQVLPDPEFGPRADYIWYFVP